MRPGAKIPDTVWQKVQSRQVGYTFDTKTGKAWRLPSTQRDVRLDEAPFNTSACRIGVLRHAVRAVKVLEHAKQAAKEAGQRLLLVVAADRAGAGPKSLHVPAHMY